jgi:hypothetical protein
MSIEQKALKRFWKPDGKKISFPNQEQLRNWMKENGLSTRPGAITLFLHSRVHESARSHSVKKLNIDKK